MTNRQARESFRSDDLIGLGVEADAFREKLHPHGIASYIIDRNINHTNECTEYCSFCAFYRPMGHAEGYVLPFETIAAKIQETVDCGGTGVLMQGGVNPNLAIEYFEDLFRRLKQRFPEVQLHCLSAPEILCIAEVSGLAIEDTLKRLQASGMDSMPGAGAEILDDEVRRRIARLKCTAEDWIAVHRTA
ncbi:MAG: radical SAM protein, partial [Bryobacterales bacterium]|nr:radical SAM protein [Bryobacterales bacterium]